MFLCLPPGWVLGRQLIKSHLNTGQECPSEAVNSGLVQPQWSFRVFHVVALCGVCVICTFCVPDMFTCGSGEGDVAKVSQLRAFSHRRLQPPAFLRGALVLRGCFHGSAWSKAVCPLITKKSLTGILALAFGFSSVVLLYEHLFSSWGKGRQTNTLSPASKDHTLAFLRVIAVNNLLQGVQICFPALLRQQPKNSNQLVIMPVRVTSDLRAAVLNKSQLVFLMFCFFFNSLNSTENLLVLHSFAVGRSDYFSIPQIRTQVLPWWCSIPGNRERIGPSSLACLFSCPCYHRLCIPVLLVELCDQAGLQKSNENLEL